MGSGGARVGSGGARVGGGASRVGSERTDGTLRRQGPLEDCDVPRGLDGGREGADDVLARREACNRRYAGLQP